MYKFCKVLFVTILLCLGMGGLIVYQIIIEKKEEKSFDSNYRLLDEECEVESSFYHEMKSFIKEDNKNKQYYRLFFLNKSIKLREKKRKTSSRIHLNKN